MFSKKVKEFIPMELSNVRIIMDDLKMKEDMVNYFEYMKREILEDEDVLWGDYPISRVLLK